MSEIYQTGADGEHLLAEYLRARGHTVTRSDRKTFDLIVDGHYAEVKSSRAPYAALQFIGLTEAQYEALTVEGVDFSVFVVCNTCDPAKLEVVEIRASALMGQQATTETTYYWYRSQLEKCRESA